MRYSLAIAALVGSSLAAPSYGAYPGKGKVEIVEHVEVVTVVKTVYVTEGTPEATQPAYPEVPAVTTTTVVKPTPTPEYVAKPPPSSPVYEAPKPEPTKEPVYEAPTAPSTGYMSVVDTWRSKLGLSPFKQSSKLEANALDCVKSSPGVMKHKLNSGSFGQVLAPGSFSDFEHVFVGGWLCERPNLPGLGSAVCDKQSVGWDYAGQTGHADILTADYKEIGCAEYDGIVACDVA